MPLQKNQIITLSIERLSGDGSGVGHWEGEAVFVPGTAPGDVIRARVVKDCKRYAFGIVEAVETASPDRIPADCPVAGPCGGCSLRHLRYQAELQAKEAAVADAFRRIGGLDVEVQPILPSPEVDRYRNKVQYPVGLDKNGKPCIGFYAGRSHRIVPCADCKLQPAVLNEIGHFLCGLFAQYGIQPYDEASGSGLVRHIFLRRGAHSGQIMVCLVCTRPRLPHAAELTAALCSRFGEVRTVLINVNPDKTNVILGRENRVLYGPGFIEDTLCGVPVRLGPLSFYQVNTPGAEQLYGMAAAYAAPGPDDLLLDLYCGMGTIGLSMAERYRALVGVEVVPEAIESAKANAARMGDAIAAKSRFFCADAGEAATRLAAEASSSLTRPARAATQPPWPPSSRCPPAAWSTSAATPPPPPATPPNSPGTATASRRSSRWICSPGRGMSRRLSCFPREKSTRRKYGWSSRWRTWICQGSRRARPMSRLRRMCWNIRV